MLPPPSMVNVILYMYNILVCTCGNSAACVCYLNWKLLPPPPPPPKQTDGPVEKAGLRSANTKHLEAVAICRGVGAGGDGGAPAPPIFRLGGAEPPQYLTSNITF